MNRRARFRYLSLALMVAVSHAVLVSHAAAHFNAALEHCELCVSQAQPLAGIPAAETVLAVECRPTAILPALATPPLLAAVEHLHRQRAPPPSLS